MNAVPEVSIVIATRNRWPLLAAHALPSALSQEHVELEVIVVDDASSDETPQRLAELADRSVVRTVRHETGRGLAAARNSGAAAARAKWLAFLDDDDLWSPRKLRTQLDAASAVGAEWVYGRAIVVDGSKRVIDAHPFPPPQRVATLLRGGNHVPGGGSNVAVRAAALHRVGGFDEDLTYFEDWDLWLRLARLGPPAACDEVLVARVEHGRNMLFRDRANVLADFERLLSKHQGVSRRDRLAVAEWLAHEHVRGGFHRRAALLYLRAALVYRSPGNFVAAGGAVFGRSGLRAASKLLQGLTGDTHLTEATEQSVVSCPAWLERYS